MNNDTPAEREAIVRALPRMQAVIETAERYAALMGGRFVIDPKKAADAISRGDHLKEQGHEK